MIVGFTLLAVHLFHIHIMKQIHHIDWISQFVAIYKGIEHIIHSHKISIAINGRRALTDVAKGLGLNGSLGYSFFTIEWYGEMGLR